MDGGSFSKLGSRLSAAHIRLKSFQQLQGWRAVPFQNWALALDFLVFYDPEAGHLQQLQGWRAARFQHWALALAPRTFVLKVCNNYKDGGRVVFKIGLSLWSREHSS